MNELDFTDSFGRSAEKSEVASVARGVFKQGMIADSIITDEMWSEAPEEPSRAFLFLAEAAYRRLKFLEANEDAQAPHSIDDWRTQYVYELATVAHELGIEGVMQPDAAIQSRGHMNQFDISLSRVVTRIKASIRAELRADSVALSFQTKADIREHLEELRSKINNSNLSDDLRAALHKRVDAVEKELEKTRANLSVFWKLAGAMTLASTVIGTAADFPAALDVTKELVHLAHHDKAREESDRHRLNPPQLSASATLQIADGGARTVKSKSDSPKK